MIDIAVLAGGRSSEHEISQLSGFQVLQNLCLREWRLWPVYIDREGRWSLPEQPFSHGDADPFQLASKRRARPGVALEHLIESCGVGLVFPVLHGRHGEDGTVQGMMELHDLAFVGSGTAASAVAMDKLRTRECLRSQGLPMPAAYMPHASVQEADPRLEAEHIAASVGFPCFVKIDHSGSTIGVSRVNNESELAAFLRENQNKGRRFLAEQALQGEEITVPVLGNAGGHLEILPPVGIYPVVDGFFTFEAKYQVGMCEEVVPPRGLSEEQVADAMILAQRCHEALHCDGLSRTDMILDAGGLKILEVNTMPGMTEMSLLPRSAAVHGLEFPELLDRLLYLAMERWGLRSRVS